MGSIVIFEDDFDVAKIAELAGNTDLLLVDIENLDQGRRVTVSDVSDDDLSDALFAYNAYITQGQDPLVVTEDVIWTSVSGVDAKNAIDAAAERARQRYITDGAGQAMVYQEKADQAADFVAAGYPADTSPYPYIEADMAALGLTKEQAADEILAVRSAWIAVSAAIEQTRLGAKNSVDQAASKTEVDSIVSSAIATLDAL